MIEQIKQDLQKITHGADWTNFDDRDYSKVVYEYDRLTESTCDIIADCESVELAHFIAITPEWLRYLIHEVERLNIALYTHESYDRTVSELHEENVELQKALEQVKSSVLEIDKVVKTAVAHGESLHYLLLSDELTKIADVADQVLEKTETT